ncbi:hypothetical protein K1719_046065 [Acacia pycnantha]|nr:hypothetical protein K1719_046065 [Acacia pycnantha]
MEALRNHNMIGLCGLGGVGKTTIAKAIEKEKENQKVFEKVIMAMVSQEMNIGHIQDQIIEKPGMQLNERTEHMENLPALTGDFSIKDRATKSASNKIFKSLFNKVLLPKLEILELSNLNNLIPLIWDDQLLHNSLNNLKTTTVEECGFVKLVPLNVLKSLNNLEELDVEDCDMLEILFDFEDLNDYYKEMDLSSVVVPLKKLKLWNLPKLKNVWSNNYQRNVSFPSLRSVDVYKCESFTKDQVSEYVAVTFSFPRLTSLMLSGLPNLMNFYPQKHTLEWPHLNKLSIQCCDELEIFEKEVSGSSEIYEEENMLDSKYPLCPTTRSLVIWRGELTLSGNFEKALGGDNVAALTAHFPKLTLEKISIMGSLSPFLVSSPNLTHLNVKWCNGTTLMTSSIARSLMKFLELDDLPILKRFCGYNYTFRFPFLEHATITKCPRLTMFCPRAIHAPWLQSVVVDKHKSHLHIWMTDLNNTIQHLFTFKEVISTTESMAINTKNITRIVDVFPKVRSLYVESFTDEGIIDFMGKIPPFKELYIAYMDNLKSIWKDDSQLPPVHQNLTLLEVKSCWSLVKLAPSSASFQNLLQLSISGCHQLIHLVTTSNAKSLVSLRQLEINDCKRMEEIVMNDTNEDVESGITFNYLYRIKLIEMPSLKMFSTESHTFEFPKLIEMEISGCPEMKAILSKG